MAHGHHHSDRVPIGVIEHCFRVRLIVVIRREQIVLQILLKVVIGEEEEEVVVWEQVFVDSTKVGWDGLPVVHVPAIGTELESSIQFLVVEQRLYVMCHLRDHFFCAPILN